MFERDSSKFAELMAGIGEIYQKEFSTVAIEAYWRILRPFRIEDVGAAVDSHMQNTDVGNFFPKPSDIIKAIGGSSQDQALSAWSKTAYAIRVVGGYSSIGFDDALIHVVVKSMISWPKLCIVDDKQLPFVEKEFLERYRGYVSRKPPSHPSYLKGTIEIQNSAFGYPYPSPVLIGDALKAKEVIAT